MPPAPVNANSNLSPNQQAFLSSFAATTGLDPTVAAAWLRNEEPNSNQNTDPAGHGAYNFLNIGITGAKSYGANSPYWQNPSAAGKASAQWMMGKLAIPGFGHSSAGIQNITRTAGQSPAAQIAAIQNSGWAAGGEKSLPGLYSQFSGQGGVTPTQAYRGTVAAPGDLTTAAAGVPQKVQGLQPAAANANDSSRNALLQWGLAQTAQHRGFSAGPNLTGQPVVAPAQGVQPMQADVPVPNLTSLFGTAQQALATGKPVTATTLQGKNGNPIAVQLDPGVNPDHTTAGAIKLAKQYLGTSYVYGGANPKTGFDCSGLISYVYGKMGISLPHYTGAMLKMGQKINPTNTAALKPGDAIFFNGGEHVGMYLGNGQFIQAPHTGDVVKISQLQGYDGGIYAVRRYA